MSFSSAGYQLQPVLPELVLAVGAMVLLMIGAYRGQGTTRAVTTLAVCLLVLTGVLELLPPGKLVTFGGSFIVDDFARFLKILALIGSVATLILSTEFLSDPSRRIFEYSILVLLSTLGMMVLISAGDLIMLYLGLELMSLALYVVAASNRDNAKSTEAGLKYFVLGALSSGMLLYGASLVYGFTGTVSFAGIAKAASAGGTGAANGQRSIKRLMAYSSIGHMGFALVGLAAGTQEGVHGVLVYMAIYVAMTLGAFACILSMRRDGLLVEEIADLSGLARTKPMMALFLLILLFSLAGIPPFAGFFAKFYVFSAAINAGLFTLAVVGVLASVVGAYYYLVIVKTMYFDEPGKEFEPMPVELT